MQQLADNISSCLQQSSFLNAKLMLAVISQQSMQHYKIKELIGQGSFGSVYLVSNQQGEQFAYKRIKVDPFQVEMAEQEIDIMRKFLHTNLVRVFQHHFQGEKEELHIIMEYCSGGDLSHLLRKEKTLKPDRILSYLQQVVSAFVAMSAQGVMHRDLKPENILLTKQGAIKIADFGCAKCVQINNLSMLDSRSMEKGSYLYVSPQQLKMEKYSFKCDVWAVGCLAYLLQYGYHPFVEANPHNVLQEINKKANSQPIELTLGTDPSIATFITLSLYYEDIERASWRQLQLCRIFAPKIKNVDAYVGYLRSLSPLANSIVKEFWKVHKSFAFPSFMDETLIYYLIKFEMDNLKMCLKVLKKNESLAYLFTPEAFKAFEPKEEIFNEVKKNYLEYEKYFLSIRKTIEHKECFIKFIKPHEPKRVSAFIDLDKSIRTAYKILRWVRTELKESGGKENRVWVMLARWINFQQWFSFEKEPNLQKILIQPSGKVLMEIEGELELYEKGSL